MKIQIPNSGHDHHEIIRVQGQLQLRIATSALNRNDKEVMFINDFFEFSDETIRSFRLRGLRAMVSVMVIVLLTTSILYPAILRLTQGIAGFSAQFLDANLDMLETLGSAIAQCDSDTNAHNYHVSIYSACIGEEIGMQGKAMRALIKGSFLHDVSKIGIPDEILWKPGLS